MSGLGRVALGLFLGFGCTCLSLGNEQTEFAPIARPLLKFANEKGKPIVLESGTKPLLHVYYGEELDTSRFSAKLNGNDVTHRFHPKPRMLEKVELPFLPGKNVVEFDIGRLPRRDLPEGALPESELHRVTVEVRESSMTTQLVPHRVPAIPPVRQ